MDEINNQLYELFTLPFYAVWYPQPTIFNDFSRLAGKIFSHRFSKGTFFTIEMKMRLKVSSERCAIYPTLLINPYKLD